MLIPLIAGCRRRVGSRAFCVALSVMALWGVSLTFVHAGSMTLGGQFSVDPSGGASYGIPVAVPPGTAGVAPSIFLAYHSSQRNGLLGVGWSLGGLSSITRCPRSVAQDGVLVGIEFDVNDRFCIDGQRLVVVSGTYGTDGAIYRTEVDTFSKIISHGTTGYGPTWFEVHTKAGQVMEYGNTVDSRIMGRGRPSARAWALDKVSDAKTNYYTITYTNDATNGQFYPTRIDYTGNTAAAVSPYNSVQFVYATRPDPVPGYQGRSTLMTTVRLTDIKVYAGTTLITDYQLAYQQSGAANRSHITSAKVCDGSGNCLPPTTFGWTNPIAGLATPSFWNSCYGTSCGWSDNNTNPRMVADVNGDGMPDVVGFASTGVYVSLNTGSSFAAATLWNPCFGTGCGWPDNITYPRMLADVNGDGLADVVGFASTGVYVSLNIGSSFAGATQWNPCFSVGCGWSDNITYPRQLTDVNGDGLPDIVGFASGGVYVSLNTGASFAPAQQWNNGYGLGSGWGDNNNNPRMVVDVNGDGLPDVVGFASTGVYVALNTGTSFGPMSQWNPCYGTNCGWSDNKTNPRMLADVNGDGLPDVVGFASTGVYVSLNTGTSFAPATQWNPCYGTGCGWADIVTAPRFLVDMDGDGLPDVVGFASTGVYVSLNTGTSFAAATQWQTQFGANSSWTDDNVAPRMLGDVLGTGYAGVVGFANAGILVSAASATDRPDLVNLITTGLGATTRISYAPATKTSVATKGSGTAFPLLDIVSPFYLVSRVDTSNGIGGTYSSTYSYSGGRIDTTGRGFLGFAQTATKDLQTNIVSTMSYRQDFPYIGQVSGSVKTLGTQVLSQSTNTYQFANWGGGTTISPSSAPYRVSLAQNVSGGSDLDGSALPTVNTTNQYDVYGNATQQVSSTSDGFVNTTANTYTNDTTNWFLGQLTRAAVTKQGSQPVQFCSLPWGGAIANGQSVTAYSAANPPAGRACSTIAQTRSCTAGTLSGSGTQRSCVAVCPLPWGGTISAGQSVTAYEVAAVVSPQICGSAQPRTCGVDGTLSGTFVNQSCSVVVHQPVIVYLTSGSSWTVPNNWNNAANKIEVIGGGGGGLGAGGNLGNGGAGSGGGYSSITNLTLAPGSTVSYNVGLAGVGGNSGTAGGDTWFNGSSLGSASVSAQGGGGGWNGGSGLSPSGGPGGQASNGIGTTKYSGGNGGLGGIGGGGGGGAAGPHGNGGAGGNYAGGRYTGGGGGGGADGGGTGGDDSNELSGAGGWGWQGTGAWAGSCVNGSDGTGAGGSGGYGGGIGSAGYDHLPVNYGCGGSGSMDNAFGAGYGSGGGGGGGGSNWYIKSGDGIDRSNQGYIGGAGASYGGGGGGGGAANAYGGAGASGIIVITYTPGL